MTPLRPGSVVDGRYEIEDLLGEGGMGVVLLARHKFTGARVALKMLHSHLRLRPDLAARFLNEARAPAAIGHPGIVRVSDAGVTPEGDPYFAMEHLVGQPLAALMRHGPPTFELARNTCCQILDALGAAHAAGFIHRDLKPENVFVEEPSGTVRLLDFGIAKSLGDMDAGSTTGTGATLGTLLYMSPEQLRNAKRVDHRTDLWAVGVIFYQLVTGRLPYRAESLGDMLMLILSQPPLPLSASLASVPPELEAFFSVALAVDPNQRFGSASEMAQALVALPPLALQRHDAPVYVPVASTFGAVPVATVDEGPRIASSSSNNWLIPVAGGIVVIGLLGVMAVVGFGGAAILVTGDQKALEPSCRRACQAIIACGHPEQETECKTTCQADPVLGRCMEAAGSDCDAVSGCFIQRLCKAKPTGTASCHATRQCADRCDPKDVACQCSCWTAADPKQAAEVEILSACSMHQCDDPCMGDQATRASCSSCVAKRCQNELRTCEAQ